jgi:octaprenyl-diphosphate synthase
MGKPVGSDLIQGTLTLPAMMLMEHNPEDNPIRKFFETRDKKHVTQAIRTILDSGIVKDCYKVAGEYRDRACRNLKSLPKAESRKSLIDLADYIIRQGT